MVGIRKLLGCGLLAALTISCGSSGVSPKAFGTDVTPNEPRATANWKPAADGSPVVVSPDVIEAWEFLYRFITETEFVLCLQGTKQDGRVIIDDFRLARMETSSVNSVRYQPCPGSRYVGTAHNHPPVDDAGKSLCYQSEPDRRSFTLDERAVVDIVLCGSDKFRWWLKDGRNADKTIDIARGK